MFAIKANKQYRISEDEKQKYIDQGYEIANLVDGKLVYEEVETEESKELVALKKENVALKTELEALKEEKKPKKEGK